MTDFEKSLRERLRSMERALDQDVAERLLESRTRICGRGTFHGWQQRLWLPFTGMALASVVLFALYFLPLSPLSSHGGNNAFPESVQIQELEFYYWLAETQSGLDS